MVSLISFQRFYIIFLYFFLYTYCAVHVLAFALEFKLGRRLLMQCLYAACCRRGCYPPWSYFFRGYRFGVWRIRAFFTGVQRP